MMVTCCGDVRIEVSTTSKAGNFTAREGNMDRTVRRVVCAAIRAEDGELLLGIRHYSPDMRRQIKQRKDGEKFNHRLDEDQGFVDQWGNWISRIDAYQIALATDRLTFPEACADRFDEDGNAVGCLYSEGLY